MKIVIIFIYTTIVPSVFAVVVPDLTPFEHEFSPETFAYFNSSNKEYKKFDLKEIEADARRWDLVWYKWFAAKHQYSYNYNYRTCIFMTMTYLAAIPDIRRYFQIRFLYVENMEYEIGYLVYDIVRKYQMLIEIYQIMYYKFYTMSDRWAAPTSYIFYMYRNALELSIAISHLCNMLHEVEVKYITQPLGPWDDYPESGEAKVKMNKTVKGDDKSRLAVLDYERRHREEQRRRRKLRKRARKGIGFGTVITTPPRRPYKSYWPLHYGWSIEFW